MARTKTTSDINCGNNFEKADSELTRALGNALDQFVKQQYGAYIAPPPIKTPFGIEPLDTLLGGGFFSNSAIRISSTPETGKSTLAFQFSKCFQNTHQNGIIAYIDIEGAGNSCDEQQYRLSRIDTFGLDTNTFRYMPMILDLEGVFGIIQQFCEIKKQAEQAQQKEFYICIVWDSIAATPSTKTAEAISHDAIIGFKARQLSFLLDKYSPMLAFNKVTFIVIDQVRANLKIEGPYAQKEKTVGSFKDYKSATSIASFDHKTSQWLFLSKKKDITLADGLGIDGWEMIISTEKNKHAPSQIAIKAIFDKAKGLDKFWTEFTFLSELIPTEEKIYKNKKPPFPPLMKQSGAWYYLSIFNPETGEEVYTSDKFYKKDAKDKYEKDADFKQYFDGAVQLSVHYRLIQGLFRYNPKEIHAAHNDEPEEQVLYEETEQQEEESYVELI